MFLLTDEFIFTSLALHLRPQKLQHKRREAKDTRGAAKPEFNIMLGNKSRRGNAPDPDKKRECI